MRRGFEWLSGNAIQLSQGSLRRARILRRKNLHCDNNGRNEQDDRYCRPTSVPPRIADPPAAKAQALAARKDKTSRRRDHRMRENRRVRRRASWRRKDTEGWTSAGHRASTRPGLNDRPPEKKASTEKRGVLEFVQPVPTQRQLKNRGDMPPDQGKRGRQPAKRGIGDEVAEPFQRGHAKNWARPRHERAIAGVPRSSGSCGAPSKIRGGATDISSRCCTM